MTRPDIKFSEKTGNETKNALERYRDSKELASIEAAVRHLLPTWAFNNTPDTLVFGKPVGFQTRIVSLTEDSVTFEQGERIELPHMGWGEIQLNVRHIEPLKSEWVENYLNKAIDNQYQWEPIDCDKSRLSESIERFRFWRSKPTASSITVNRIHIPRSRLEDQITVLNKAVEKELTDTEAENITELTKQMHTLHKDELRYEKNSNVQRKINSLEANIVEIAPDWLITARDVESELIALAKVMNALHPSEKQYK